MQLRVDGRLLLAPPWLPGSVSRSLPTVRWVVRLLQKQTPSCRPNVALRVTASSDDSVTTASRGTALATAELPTIFERLVAALMFLLPLSEGTYRISLSFVEFCKHQALELMYWCHHQHRQISLALAARTISDISADDISTLQTLMQMSERMHQWFSHWSLQLGSLTKPIQQFRDHAMGSEWLSVALGTPEALWQFGCLCYMSILAGIAALNLHKHNNNKGNGFTLFFRKPQVVTVSYICALLMRLSWSPMEGMSEMSLDVYWMIATFLTVITTVCAATQIHRLLFARLPKLVQFLENMVQEVTWLAHMHRSFLLLDWMLCLISKESYETKWLRSALMLFYWRTIGAFESAAQSFRRQSK